MLSEPVLECSQPRRENVHYGPSSLPLWKTVFIGIVLFGAAKSVHGKNHSLSALSETLKDASFTLRHYLF